MESEPRPRCSGCNRLSPTTLRNKGNGIYWCGRTACLPKVRELIREPPQYDYHYILRFEYCTHPPGECPNPE